MINEKQVRFAASNSSLDEVESIFEEDITESEVSVSVDDKKLMEDDKSEIDDATTNFSKSIYSEYTEGDNVDQYQGFFKVADIPAGRSFGELALITNAPRSARILCL